MVEGVGFAGDVYLARAGWNGVYVNELAEFFTAAATVGATPPPTVSR